jgi:hypothetical protein
MANIEIPNTINKLMCHKGQVGEWKKFPNYIKMLPHMPHVFYCDLNYRQLWVFDNLFQNNILFVGSKSELIFNLIFIP